MTTQSPVRAVAGTTTIGLIAGALGAIGLMEGASGGIWSDVLRHFGLGDSALGPAFALQAAVVLPVLIFGGQLLQRFGLRIMIVVGAVLMGLASVGLLSLSMSATFFALFIIRGFGVALLDLAGNTMAMHVERENGIHIMGIVHGGFSIGIVIGSLIAYGIYQAGGTFTTVHLVVAISLGLFAIAAAVGPVPNERSADAVDPITIAAFRLPLVRFCAVILGLAFGGELLISQFVSVLLRTRTEASDSFAVLAVVVYATMMAIGRFSNGALMSRFGALRLMMWQGAGVTIGGAILATAPNAGITLVGSLIGGLAIAGVVPTVLSYAAAHSPGSPGETASASLLGGYLGGLIIPLLAGGLTSLFSIRVGIALVMVAGVLTVLLCQALKRDRDREDDSVRPSSVAI
ncbi:MAG TPA: MFS transporter [Thermomicrobiales bacterium]|nr:MFS transporter [Thermomicrobiales bacterium]